MDVEVTSVSRRAEPYRDTAAALTVVTPEHIRRSGATTVPEALRWVPGLHVARQSASGWAVSSRGFSSVNSEKLLVLSDTRSIYTPLFSGVFWDVQNYLMADIDRIEVIRGPGAALWGSNAVNGVINITTKHAASTQGTHLEASAGTDERAMVAARYGGRTAGGGHFRVFGKYVERGESAHAAASSDDWQLGHVGFRADWSANQPDAFTLQADLYRGNIGQLAPTVEILGRPGPVGPLNTRVGGGNILGRWQRQLSGDSSLQLRAYYDRTHRNDPSFTDDLHTVDVDLQHHWSAVAPHTFVWGLNYRHTTNRNTGKGVFAVQPARSRNQLFSAFAQDQLTWGGLRVTVGTKAEHNDFSGFELQPSIRAAWDFAPGHTLWGAISRAARIPTRLERDIFIDASDPAGATVARLIGSDEFGAEELTAYELGYRWSASPALNLDVALFENRYDGLASLEFGTPFSEGTRTIIPILNRNLNDARAHGGGAIVTFSPLDQWRVSTSYSVLDLGIEPAGQDLNRGIFYDGATPRHQFSVNSYLTLPGGLELDLHFRRLGGLRRLPQIVTGEGIPGYSELDVHLSWRVSDQLRLTMVGQNLLHDEHVEFGAPAARGGVERGGYLKATWDF